MCECCEHWSTTLSHTETTARHCHTAHPPACPPDEVFLSCGVGTPRRGLFPLHFGAKLLKFAGPKTEPSEERPPPPPSGWLGGWEPTPCPNNLLSVRRTLAQSDPGDRLSDHNESDKGNAEELLRLAAGLGTAWCGGHRQSTPWRRASTQTCQEVVRCCNGKLFGCRRTC